MLSDEPEIWRLAQLLLKRHGGRVGDFIRRRADSALGSDDLGEYLVWMDILEATAELHGRRDKRIVH